MCNENKNPSIHLLWTRDVLLCDENGKPSLTYHRLKELNTNRVITEGVDTPENITTYTYITAFLDSLQFTQTAYLLKFERIYENGVDYKEIHANVAGYLTAYFDKMDNYKSNKSANVVSKNNQEKTLDEQVSNNTTSNPNNTEVFFDDTIQDNNIPIEYDGTDGEQVFFYSGDDTPFIFKDQLGTVRERNLCSLMEALILADKCRNDLHDESNHPIFIYSASCDENNKLLAKYNLCVVYSENDGDVIHTFYTLVNGKKAKEISIPTQDLIDKLL